MTSERIGNPGKGADRFDVEAAHVILFVPHGYDWGQEAPVDWFEAGVNLEGEPRKLGRRPGLCGRVGYIVFYMTHDRCSWAALAFALTFAAHLAAQGNNQPGTKWSDQQLKETVDLARVGRRLTPKSWPNGARVAVCLSFDDDTEAPLLRDGTTSPTTLSASDFGAESGTSRILRMLEHYEVPATFFVTGVDAMLHPEMLQAILKSGRNEVGIHGWIHEFPPRLAEGEEERLLDKAIAYLTKAAGKRPVGYRAPSWAFSGETLDLIRKKGFLYDSSLQALDEPYEIVSRGQNTGLIELSIDWTLTETPYLGQNGHMPSPELLYQLYKDEFDGAYAEGTTFILTLHPYLSGHRAPMKHLDEFVAYMKSKPGVWFATCEQVARAVAPK